MITENNITRHELIGLNAEVVEGNSEGLKGKVVDETMNRLTIDTTKGEKKILKKGSSFRFTIPSKKKIRVNGNVILARPEDRIKKRLKKW